MNKAATQLYGDAIDNVNGRIIYETKSTHLEIRRTPEYIEIFTNEVNDVDFNMRDGFKGTNYTVE